MDRIAEIRRPLLKDVAHASVRQSDVWPSRCLPRLFRHFPALFPR
jgi:hypothetical protein